MLHRVAPKCRIGSEKLLEKLQKAKACLIDVEKKMVWNGDNETCNNCGAIMVQNEVENICTSCGCIGTGIEVTPASYSTTATQGYNGYTYGSSNSGSSNDNYNNMYTTVLRRLTNRQQKAKAYPIPQEILRDTARVYTELCQSIRCKLILENKENKRCNMVLPGILKQQLDKHENMSRTDTYICEFMGINKSILTKAKNKLQILTKNGFIDIVPVHDRTASFAYQFLDRLEMDTIHTDLVVRIIRRANIQIDMIAFRTTQINTSVVGTIWLLIRQLGIKMPHCIINTRLFSISKSTYTRFSDFLDTNRRRINPLLQMKGIRPIPRSFAIKRPGRGSKKLQPIPNKYIDMYLQK